MPPPPEDHDTDRIARERVAIAAARQSWITYLGGVRRQLLIGGLQAGVGAVMFVGCIYLAMRTGTMSLWPCGAGFVFVMAGAVRVVRALVGARTIRRRLRAHDEHALPAARIVKS